MNENEAIAEWCKRRADGLEALADHIRSLGKTGKADGVMVAVNALRADARVFSMMARPSGQPLFRRVK